MTGRTPPSPYADYFYRPAEGITWERYIQDYRGVGSFPVTGNGMIILGIASLALCVIGFMETMGVMHIGTHMYGKFKSEKLWQSFFMTFSLNALVVLARCCVEYFYMFNSDVTEMLLYITLLRRLHFVSDLIARSMGICGYYLAMLRDYYPNFKFFSLFAVGNYMASCVLLYQVTTTLDTKYLWLLYVPTAVAVACTVLWHRHHTEAQLLFLGFCFLYWGHESNMLLPPGSVIDQLSFYQACTAIAMAVTFKAIDARSGHAALEEKAAAKSSTSKKNASSHGLDRSKKTKKDARGKAAKQI